MKQGPAKRLGRFSQRAAQGDLRFRAAQRQTEPPGQRFIVFDDQDSFQRRSPPVGHFYAVYHILRSLQIPALWGKHGKAEPNGAIGPVSHSLHKKLVKNLSICADCFLAGVVLL